MKGLLTPPGTEIADNAVDITAPAVGVEVVIDWTRKVVHVNVDGVCALRVCRAQHIEYTAYGVKAYSRTRLPKSKIQASEVRKYLLAMDYQVEYVDEYMAETAQDDGFWADHYGSLSDIKTDFDVYLKGKGYSKWR